ncbi:hypothetical protein ACIRBY_37225 [Streptomyces sp. NPDC096136]|uniref:hypothetical protein n=1 Tax=Streptomyces sp. NPDC096136 TaxID=3366076 RepID=UPI00380EB656
MPQGPGDRRRLTRDEISAAYGYSPMKLKRLWADRDSNGHPPAKKAGRTLTWDAEEWEQWDRNRQALIGVVEVSAILGHADHTWASKAAVAPPEGFPAPIEWSDPVARRGPRWRQQDIEHYAETRTLPKPPAGAGRPSGARHGTAYVGDPRLDLARQVLAEHPDERPARHIERLHALMPGSSASTWTKILKAARDESEPQ